MYVEYRNSLDRNMVVCRRMHQTWATASGSTCLNEGFWMAFILITIGTSCLYTVLPKTTALLIYFVCSLPMIIILLYLIILIVSSRANAPMCCIRANQRIGNLVLEIAFTCKCNRDSFEREDVREATELLHEDAIELRHDLREEFPHSTMQNNLYNNDPFRIPQILHDEDRFLTHFSLVFVVRLFIKSKQMDMILVYY
jgi:hypothetical protein